MPSASQDPRDRDPGYLAALRERQPVRVLLLCRPSATRTLLAEGLRRQGHRVCVAGQMDEVIEHTLRERFEVALVLVPGNGAARLLDEVRALDPDLEVLWSPGSLTVKEASERIHAAAERARLRMDELLKAAAALLEPLRPEETAALLLERAQGLLGAEARLAPPEEDEPQEALLSDDGRALRVPLWRGGPSPDGDGPEGPGEDSGHRLVAQREPGEAGFTRGEVERAVVLASLGSLALTRAHCEEALADLYEQLEDRPLPPSVRG